MLAEPGILLLFILFILPAIPVFVIAARRHRLAARGEKSQLCRAQEFELLWQDADFWHSMINTLAFVSVCVPVTVSLGLVVALLTRRNRAFVPSIVLSASYLSWPRWLQPRSHGSLCFTTPR
jgi:ABC-type sugar transport system permease subunit